MIEGIERIEPRLLMRGTVFVGPVQLVPAQSGGGTTSLPLSPANSTAAADLNRDGRTDIVRADYYGCVIRIGYGPAWQTDAIVPVSSAPDHAAVADVNGDGWSDLLVSSYDAGTVTVRHGPTFAGSSTIAVPGVREVVPADLDGDGDSDLVASRSYLTGLVILRNSAGAFSTQTIAGAYTASDVAVDADGDIYAIDYFRDKLVRHANTGGVIAPGVVVATIVGGVSIDRDGGELYVAGFVDGKITRISTANHAASLFAQAQPGVSSVSALAGEVRWSDSVDLWLGEINGDGVIDEMSCERLTLSSTIPPAS